MKKPSDKAKIQRSQKVTPDPSPDPKNRPCHDTHQSSSYSTLFPTYSTLSAILSSEFLKRKGMHVAKPSVSFCSCYS